MTEQFSFYEKMRDRDLQREFHRINFRGTILHGVLSTPGKPKSEWRATTAILIPYGLNPRFGPHQIYLKIERELCRSGFPVFRFDSFGCGDSGGDFTELSGLHRDDVFWRLIYDRRFLDDVLAAVDHVEGTLHPEKIVLGGICGGAVRSLFVATQRKIVKGVFPIGFPSTIDDTTLDSVDKMNAKMAEFFFYAYFKKIFSTRSWLRLISLKSDYRTIFKSVKMMIGKRIKKNSLNCSSDAQAPGKKKIGEGRTINTQLIESIRGCFKEDRKLLVVYGENDRYLGDYEEIIEGRCLGESTAGIESNYKKVVVSNSNHEFSFSEWQKELTHTIRDWMVAYF